MATAEDLVTDALRLIGQMDQMEEAPSPAQMTIGLRTLEMMIASWETKNLNIVDQTLTGDVTVDSALITGLSTTIKLAPGMNVTGTGVSGRIQSIDRTNNRITLSTNATASGSGVSLSFKALPFEAKYEQGVSALLAMNLAFKLGETEISDMVRVLANDGWTALEANFLYLPEATFDNALLFTSVRRAGIVPFSG